MRQYDFGTTKSGRRVSRFELSADGISVALTDYGATVLSLHIPDRYGEPGDVVLGFDTLAEYEQHDAYFGATIGRFANRIAGGRFELDGHLYTLAQNEGENHLHGGLAGFDKQLWRAEVQDESLLFKHVSPDGHGGYPGRLEVGVRYQLGPGVLHISYEATTDAPTVLNLTNHSYFNLAGSGDVLEHVLRLRAARFLCLSEKLIPTGELGGVTGTPLDFRTPQAIGERIDEASLQLARAGGYDHFFVLDDPEGNPLTRSAAEVYEPTSGRRLRLYTDQPGVQVYTSNMLEPVRGKNAQIYPRRAALCLEAQGFPDSPNQAAFPSLRLEPGEVYRSEIRFVFDVV